MDWIDVRSRGAWLALFLDGIQMQATDALTRAERLTDLREGYRGAVRALTRGVTNDLVDLAFEQPILNAHMVELRLGISRPAAIKALRLLGELKILSPLGQGPRGQLRWVADHIMAALTD